MANEKHDCFFDRAVFDDVTNTARQTCVHQIHRFLPVDSGVCKSCPVYATYDEMFDRLKAERGDDCLGE